MRAHALDAKQGSADSYLFGRRQAWFAFAMTIALMVFDYVDRQVIVSLFPHMKQDWGLSDKELGRWSRWSRSPSRSEHSRWRCSPTAPAGSRALS